MDKKTFRQIVAQKIIKEKRLKITQEINNVISKKAGSNLNWDVIHKAKNRFGEEYTVEKINNDKIHLYNSEEDFTGPMGIIVPAFDFYDDENNLVSQGS